KPANTNVYISQIGNKELFPPTVSPVTTKSKTYNSVEWKTLNQSLLNAKRQNKINQDWAEVYSKFFQFKLIYDSVQKKSFDFQTQKDNEINSMIKQSIPSGCSTKISRWRKAYNLVVLVIEKSNDICLEDFLEEIRDLNITFNYLQEVEPAEFMTLLNKIVENYKLKIEIQ
ncbi:650_t:CDS:1, partial [Dentiscutata erythropus]